MTLLPRQREAAVSPVESMADCLNCDGSGDVAVREPRYGRAVDSAPCPVCGGDGFVMVDDERRAS
jgi:DnaJ-class molecular chaperone